MRTSLHVGLMQILTLLKNPDIASIKLFQPHWGKDTVYAYSGMGLTFQQPSFLNEVYIPHILRPKATPI